MRLIGRITGGDFKFSTCNNYNIPLYAVLTSTWSEGKEVTYNELFARARVRPAVSNSVSAKKVL